MKVQCSRLLFACKALGAKITFVEGAQVSTQDALSLAALVAASGAQVSDLRDWFKCGTSTEEFFHFGAVDEAISQAEYEIERKAEPALNGHVDVLCGFSQGADLAILLGARAERGLNRAALPQLRAVVCLEADHPYLHADWAVGYRDTLLAQPLALPALVVGASQTVFPRAGAADEVAKLFAAPERTSFAEGHRALPRERAACDALCERILRFVWERCAHEPVAVQ